jgi:hypothetical protein
MSEPSQGGPQGFAAAPRPTAPYPTAPRPTAQYPMAQDPMADAPTTQFPAQYPTAQYPAEQYPTRQGPPPSSPSADHDDYGGAYRDDHRDDRRDAYESSRPRRHRRGQLFAGVVLVLALIVSALLGVLTYQTLASFDLGSADPVGSVAGWAGMLAVVALVALGVFVLAVIAFVIARPKALAGFGFLASVLLPVGAVLLGLVYGGDVLRQNVEADVAAAGPAAVDAVIEELERNVPDIGPLRDLIIQIAGQGG